MNYRLVSFSILAILLIFVLAGCSNRGSGEGVLVDPVTLKPLPTLERAQFNYFKCTETLLAKGFSDNGAKSNCLYHLDGPFNK